MKRQKLLFDVGINDADYPVTRYETLSGKRVEVWRCPFYIKWKNMLQRGYDQLYLAKNKSYSKVKISEEWLRFSNFKFWMETQDWEGKELDKDILVKDNQLYSKDTCVFVSRRINIFLAGSKRENKNSDFTGVSLNRRTNKFISQIQNPISFKKINLGYYENDKEAHLAYCKKKFEFAYKIIEEEQPEQRVADAIIKRYKDQLTEAEKLLSNKDFQEEM